MFQKTVYNEVYQGAAPEGTLALERDGHYVLRNEFSAAEVERLRSAIQEVYRQYPPDPRAARLSPENAAQFRYEMFNRSAACQLAIARPAVLAILEPLLGGDCHVISCTAWQNPPGRDVWNGGLPAGQQWHVDGGPHVPRPADVPWPEGAPYPIFVVTTHLYLQPVRLEDGPTCVVPGSHTSGQAPPRDRIEDAGLSHRGRLCEMHLVEPGDVGFFVSDVWHRRFPPAAHSAGRLFLQTCYARRDIAQRVRVPEEVAHARPEAIARAGDARCRQLIGLHGQGFYDS